MTPITASRGPETVVVSVRLSIELREALQKAAVAGGISLSDHVRTILVERARTKASPAGARFEAAPAAVAFPLPLQEAVLLSEPVALEELRRIGININQLAKHANSGYPLDMAHLATSLGKLLEAVTEPEEFRRRAQLIKSGIARPTITVPAAIVPERVEPPPKAVEPIPPPAQPRSLSGTAQRPPRRPGLPTTARVVTRPLNEAHDDPTHSRPRNQLQDGRPIHPARPRAGGDEGARRLGLLDKLWRR